jgi:hypothetical protein
LNCALLSRALVHSASCRRLGLRISSSLRLIARVSFTCTYSLRLIMRSPCVKSPPAYRSQVLFVASHHEFALRQVAACVSFTGAYSLRLIMRSLCVKSPPAYRSQVLFVASHHEFALRQVAACVSFTGAYSLRLIMRSLCVKSPPAYRSQVHIRCVSS